jgi:threonyl-tRNA synthetase
MKILLLHSDFIEWEPRKKAISKAEKAGKKPVRVEEALAVFSSVEKPDQETPDQIATDSVKEILKVAGEVKASKVVLYPYVHLSQEPSNPDTALKVLDSMESLLKKAKMKVFRAPFGWYKAFNIKVKGHPLSELSREITAGGRAPSKKDDEPEALKKEQTLKSEFFIFTPDNKKHPIRIESGKVKGFDFSKHGKLGKLVKHELMKDRKVDKEPPHIPLMKRLELVDYESGSDPGHFRFYPKGKLLKSLIERWTTRKTLEYGAMEVETPIMYDYEHPSLKKYLNRFPARQYTIETPNKRVFLRFSACFGQFLMKHDASISYRNLPLRLYELTRYSFRVEQRGELAGLRRLRAFTMPDCHAACADIEQAKQEMLTRFKLCEDVLEGVGLSKKNDIELAIRVVKGFYDKNKDYVHGLVRSMGKPALVEIWDKRFFYFVLKHEWNFVDALDKAATLSTDQIDIENADFYNIRFTDRDNKKKLPVILHCSPSGAVERVIYALLEKEYMNQKAGRNPMLPLWLSPTQVRLAPVNDKMIPYCEKLADKLGKSGIRVDIDDRVESVSKKVREAEVDWIPYSIVIGDREKSSGKLPLRFRGDGKVTQLSLEGVIKKITSQTKGYPSRPLPMDRLLSRRPVFFG